jgi:hypothetical protein
LSTSVEQYDKKFIPFLKKYEVPEMFFFLSSDFANFHALGQGVFSQGLNQNY